MVWPRFRVRRSPCSNGSRSQTPSLSRTLRSMIAARAASSRAQGGAAASLDQAPQRRVADEPRLHRLGHAIAAEPDGERSQHRHVGEDGDRRPEGPDRVLRRRQVDRHLAADGAVGLGEPRGRHLDERQSAAVEGRRRPGEVADRPAARPPRGARRARRPRTPARSARARAAASASIALRRAPRALPVSPSPDTGARGSTTDTPPSPSTSPGRRSVPSTTRAVGGPIGW